MIIIEGPDTIGKTSLARMLCTVLNGIHQLPHAYAHMGCPAVELWTRHGAVGLHCERAARHSVQDRFHMSDLAYGAACRNGNFMMCPNRYAILDSQLRSELGAMTILMYDADGGELIRQRWEQAREMYPLDRTLAVNRAYKEIAQAPGQRWRGYEATFDCVLPLRRDCMEMPAVVDVFLQSYLARYNAL